MPMCILIVSRTSGIIFSPNTNAIIDHSQLMKDIDSYVKSILSPSSVQGPATISRYSFYRMGRVNLESEFTIEINFCHGWDSNPESLA